MSDKAGTPPAPSTYDNAAAISALDAVIGTATADTPEAEVPADTAAAAPSTPDAVDAKAGEDKVEAPEKAPAAPDTPVQAQDLSWAPEKIHPFLKTADPETIEEIKRSTLRWKDYTQKTQAVAAERKEIEALKAAAEKWRKLEESPEAAKAAMRILDGEPASEPEPEEAEIDLLTADPKSQRAYLEKVAERKAAELLAKRESEVAKAQAAQAARADAIRTTVREWALERGLTQEEVNAAAVKADAFASKFGIRVDETNITDLLTQFAQSAPASASKPVVGGNQRGLASVAAPSGKGSASVTPKVVPKYILEKRAPNTRADGVDLAKSVLRDSFNLDLSNTGLDDYLNSLK